MKKLTFFLAGLTGVVLLGILASCGRAQPPATAPVAEAPNDPVDNVLGEYTGTLAWNGGGKTAAEAKVIAEGNDSYRVVFTAPPAGQPVAGRNLHLEMTAKLDGDKIEWSGKVAKTEVAAALAGAKLSGKVKEDGTDIAVFELAKTVRHSPTEGMKPPAGAIVLLPYEPGKATNLDEWTNQNWKLLTDGSAQVQKGDNRTRREFGDMQLHLEFMTPYMPDKRGQERGNSGVYLQDRYEVQVLDSFGLDSQDNDCGGIYKVAKPKVNACLPPLAWQTYDMVFHAPRLDADGKVTKPANVTVRHNGEIIHENQDLPGPTGGGAPGNVKAAPIKLQDHGNPMRFRNIWAVELKDGQ